ncbi:MAG: sugar O-methyltransferase [Leptospira sp.]|nr:MAG: sugar O-methyltransferase [Leptospira sp.]
MIFSSKDAIYYLVNHLDQDDPATSSHWRKYHKDFKVADNLDISGIIGFGGNSKQYKGLKKWIHLGFQARYRVLGKVFSYFNDIDAIALKMTQMQGRAYDLDVLRQTLSLSFLMDNLKWNPLDTKDKTVAVIGDGFASMSLLLLLSGFAKKVILVNLSKTLLVDLILLNKYFDQDSSKTFTLITNKEDIPHTENADLVAIQATNHELLRSFPIDLFINIASMQEMNPDTISSYFSDFRVVANKRDSYFYCCNRIEKTFPEGTTVRFNNYPWKDSDIILLDELCPWHQQYYSIIPPFYHPYDGPIQHRFVKLSGD